LDKFIDYVKQDSTFVEFNVTHLDHYLPSETISMVSTIRDDPVPEIINNTDVIEIREDRANTELSIAPEGLALPASVAVSRKNTFKKIPYFFFWRAHTQNPAKKQQQQPNFDLTCFYVLILNYYYYY